MIQAQQIRTRAVPVLAQELSASGIPPLLARLCAARGISTASELELALNRLPSFTLLMNAQQAAQRLAEAITRQEQLLIVADYDADGATACAVGIRGLRAMGAKVTFIVPNRFQFGYGLTPEIVALAAQHKPSLLITVDNGIASTEGVAAAYARGIEVLITDHHLPGEKLPKQAIIVNPNQAYCLFPSKNIAGVGVMFYVLLALRAHLRTTGFFTNRVEPNLADLLDLVALGTVADVVKLDHTNRILVHHGLQRIRGGKMQAGVAALLRVAGRNPVQATTYDLGFVLGPRLNAAGRLADMSLGISCLISDDEAQAFDMARQLDRLNQERKDIEASMQEDALAHLTEQPPADRYSICLFHPAWHQGVIGIVAARLKERYHRPTIIFAPGQNGELKGSGRSIPSLHLRDVLDLIAKKEPDLITQFGGHAGAAGLTLQSKDFARFSISFERAVRNILTVTELEQIIETDGSLPVNEISFNTLHALDDYVWGHGFPAPYFDDRFAIVDQRRIGEKHLRLRLKREGTTINGVLFNQLELLPDHIRAIYRLERNEYQGLIDLQIVIEHWLPE